MNIRPGSYYTCRGFSPEAKLAVFAFSAGLIIGAAISGLACMLIVVTAYMQGA